MNADVEWTDEYLKHDDTHPLSIAGREAIAEYHRKPYRAELARLTNERDQARNARDLNAKLAAEEKQARKEQNTRLLGGYLSAMRALQGMTDAFGALGIDNPRCDAALGAAYAEIERYLKHYAPITAGKSSKLIWERRPCGNNLESILHDLVGQKVMVTYKDGGVEVTGILEIMSTGSRYVRARFTNRERPMEVIPLYNIRRITAT